jgi:hypothetical protein
MEQIEEERVTEREGERREALTYRGWQTFLLSASLL